MLCVSDSLLSGIGATVIGGLILAVFFFVLREYIFKIQDINGLWIFETCTNETTYNPYKNLKLTYLVLLWQEGNLIRGTGEKVQENVNGEIRTYTGKYRSAIDLSGYLTKNYLRKDTVVIHYI